MVEMVRGSSPKREWTQVIIWLGAEEELLNWSFDYYVVLSGQMPIGRELTKREAWELYRPSRTRAPWTDDDGGQAFNKDGTEKGKTILVLGGSSSED